MKTTMSCEITLKSSLVDLAKAKQVLFPGEKQGEYKVANVISHFFKS